MTKKRFVELKSALIADMKAAARRDLRGLKKSLAECEARYLAKGKAASIGEVHEWKGKKYRKVAAGKWRRIYDNAGDRNRGMKIAWSAMIRSAAKIGNPNDLRLFVEQNVGRFRDENGNLWKSAQQIRDEVRLAKNPNARTEAETQRLVNEAKARNAAAIAARNGKTAAKQNPQENEKFAGLTEAEYFDLLNRPFSPRDEETHEKIRAFAQAKHDDLLRSNKYISEQEAKKYQLSRAFSEVPTAELRQRLIKLDRRIKNKTRNQRDRLNNAIFREDNTKQANAIRAELERRKSPAEAHRNRSEAMKGNQNA